MSDQRSHLRLPKNGSLFFIFKLFLGWGYRMTSSQITIDAKELSEQVSVIEKESETYDYEKKK